MSDRGIALEDLRVETAAGTAIVDGVTLRLERGDILGVVGESGSGKTTTALALFGLARGGARIARGSLRLPARGPLDLTASRDAEKLRGRSVAYVPQSPGTALNPAMRVGRALQEMQEHRERGGRGDGGDRKRERAEVLEVVGLPSEREFQRRFPHQLSGGQQQRVCIAVALLSGADMIVLDEPTTGLDVITQGSVLRELQRLQTERDVAMIYISHDLAVVAQLATSVAVMYSGRVVEAGSREDVLRRPAHPYTRGLLDSTPDHRQTGRVHPMPGTAMLPTERTGDACTFAKRCPRAADDCRTSEPRIEILAPGNGRSHSVRCYHPVRETFALTARTLAPPSQLPGGKALSVTDLTVAYTVRGERVEAVSDVSFAVETGECLALVGESGSGKSTIARAIAGLQSFDQGTILLQDERLAPIAAKRTADQRRRLQLIFQDAGLALNPREDVEACIQRSSRLCPVEARRPVEDVMDLVKLPRTLVHRLPNELSGGERQRVLIARALATDPDLLVCDEITSALDVSVQAAVLALMHELREELSLSLLFITHDMGVVADLADRVMVLRGGVACESGPTRALLDKPRSTYARSLMEAVPSLSLEGRSEEEQRKRVPGAGTT